MVLWVYESVPLDGPIELFLILARTPQLVYEAIICTILFVG